jgi:CcmD family protein
MKRFLRLCAVAAALFIAAPIASGMWSAEALGRRSLGEGGLAKAEQPQPPKGFVAVDEIPPGEQIPAVNLVAAAYGFVWVAMLGYVWSIARRLRQVEAEISDLESRRR